MTSNILIDHVLGGLRPSVGDRWYLRRGDRVIIIDEVHDSYMIAHSDGNGRRTSLLIETVVSRYAKVED